MRKMPLEKRGISDSRLVLGCMGFGGGWNRDPYTTEHIKQAQAAVEAALSIGITMYDHADIYTMGKAEAVFGQVLKQQPDLRDNIVIQSKCGIVLAEDGKLTRFDFSKSHILESVDGTLARLGIEYLDVLLLHRPDPLMEPEEIAEAFGILKQSGKVRHFGVSNMSPGQIRFIQRELPDELVVNQLEMNLARLDWLNQGIHVNQQAGLASNFAEGLMEYMQTENMQIQAWGPLARGRFTGKPSDNPSAAELATTELVAKLAKQNETSPEAISLGWLMRHPSRIQPVIGSANPERIIACKDAIEQAELITREQWNELYVTARGAVMP
ncbi:aldo/keto reductase [Paenibacillus harenae]|uniref:Oxidoreductase n=1 Tax=Paenibacillus harenae TaxID=306543 RepID=A0ABT9TZL7_PAEHA|nr:aldo/keto reductase [Paenibacillus harenae]MDQ0111895.1 putative oxidoreductase [Paenibacillus harenae]